jgi:hypothetical protein
MKKLRITAAIVTAVPIIALSGCGKEAEEAVSLPENFSITAEITQEDFTASADMKRLNGGWEITVTVPDTLSGMQITLTDADCTVDYRELSYTAANEDMPANSPLRLTAQVLDKCVKSKTSGTINGADYEISFKNGQPDSLQIGNEIEVNFSGYQS